MLEHTLIPASVAGSRRLLIMMHGLGDSTDGYEWMPQALALPALNYLLVNAPEPYYGGFSWFDFPGDMRPGVARSRKLVFELMERLEHEGWPADQMVLGGFSQGCVMAIDVGLRYPRRLAGVLGISGHVCDVENLLKELSPVARQQRLLVTHGTMDSVIPLRATQPLIERLRQAGIPVEWQVYQKDHTIAGEAELSVIRNFIQAGFAG
jgi:phospholipase/carboxylesterase